MKENKGKGHANGDEVVQIEGDALIQSHPSTPEKRKTVSRTIDTRNFPSRWGNKKPKLGSFTLSKCLIIEVDPSVPLAITTQPSMTPKVITPSIPDASPSLNPSTVAPPKSYPLTLLRSESLAQDRFQQPVTDKDVTICYDMSMKEFEQSTIHDLFKVFSFFYNHL